MAASFRLNGLHIFLILLAVLLIGYLLNYTWESFQCGCGNDKPVGAVKIAIPGRTQTAAIAPPATANNSTALATSPLP